MAIDLTRRKPRVSFPMEETSSTRINEPRRCGDWIITSSGRQFWPLDPRPEEVDLGDIATALSKICRWGGHIAVEGIFSVAQHCVLVAMNSPHRYRKEALLHDAHEAYLCDVPRPIKRYLVNYEVIAARLDGVISDRFGVELCELPQAVTREDNRGLATERRDLLPTWPVSPGEAQGEWMKPWMARIVPWSPTEARENYLSMASALGIR
jgi:uncharacterized protein